MVKSMTGYGFARVEAQELQAQLILKALNNRYLELSVGMPGSMAAYERLVRERIEARVRRGKLEFSLKASGGDLPVELRVDTAAAVALAEALRGLAKACAIDEPLRLQQLLAFEGIVGFHRGQDEGRLWSIIEPALDACLDAFEAEREREGAAIRADLEAQLAAVEAAVGEIGERAQGLEAALLSELRRRFQEVLGDLADEARILQELAAYLAKHTINEELVRLRSHIAAFRAAMEEDQCGKKLDFICQELNREANTIGSKSAMVEVTHAVIRMKDAIENLREQARNVE